MKITKFINILINTAYKSNLKFKHSAIIISGGKCVSVANNSDRTYIDGKIYGGLHAEHAVIRKCKKQLRGATLIVIRLSKTGLLSESMPCVQCKKIISDCGIKKIYYSNNNGFIKTKINNVGTHYSNSYRRMQELNILI